MGVFMMLSREVKRVPMDFDAPLRKVWKGYKRSCGDDACENDGCKECENVEPPVGEGYQLWETVSEGSPLTPVFDTKEKLATYLSSTEREHDITNGISFENWMKIIDGQIHAQDIHTKELI